MATETNPVNWDWKLDGDELLPVMCDMNAAKDTLLKIIRCSCITSCSGNCCSCRTYGLTCSSVCGSCQVTRCDDQVLDELDSSDEDYRQ